MKNKLRQIIYDLRHQPVIAWVTFIATTLAVFLIMVVVMTQQVKVLPFAPESCRPRLLVGHYIHIKGVNGNDDSSGGMSYSTARFLYADLDGVERVSYFHNWTGDADVSDPSGDSFSVKCRTVDAEFFNIFDHTLVQGRYFTADEADASLPVVVLSETTARRAMGGEAPRAGERVVINQKPYTVAGVVRDNSALATTAYGEVFFPLAADHDDSGNFGPVSAALLVKEGVDFEHVRDQVKSRYAALDTKLATQEKMTVYHGAPFDQETIAAGIPGSNGTPDPDANRRQRLIIYAILLVVPAINLSSMLHSRMRRRIREIGVRRAFGCTRSRVMLDILAENFIVTLAGGIAGVVLGVVFASTYSGLYENMDNYGATLTPALSTLLNWGTVLTAVGVCFLLNLLSASVPAWQASRLNPVEAINSK